VRRIRLSVCSSRVQRTHCVTREEQQQRRDKTGKRVTDVRENIFRKRKFQQISRGWRNVNVQQLLYNNNGNETLHEKPSRRDVFPNNWYDTLVGYFPVCRVRGRLNIVFIVLQTRSNGNSSGRLEKGEKTFSLKIARRKPCYVFHDKTKQTNKIRMKYVSLVVSWFYKLSDVTYRRVVCMNYYYYYYDYHYHYYFEWTMELETIWIFYTVIITLYTRILYKPDEQLTSRIFVVNTIV